ncbi:MAG: pyrimidine 5'-nucleotidase [Proteobacteria bacterium]|nr:pyrimidine 5'-nucleotidase [Pseudomonadota bacterium]
MTHVATTLRLPQVDHPAETVWLFDLDNTLYPASCNLFHQVDARMAAFIAGELTITEDEARLLQKHFYRTYGTTLRGLMVEHNLPADRFLEFVHAIDVTPVPPSPALDAALGALHGRKLIFTNGSIRHAENVLDRLGVAHRFDAIFDIVAANYVPKPDPAPYHEVVRQYGFAPALACMIEDLPRNLVPGAGRAARLTSACGVPMVGAAQFLATVTTP